MKHIVRILSITLAALMLIASLAACSNSNDPATDTTVSDTSSETGVNNNGVVIFEKDQPTDYEIYYLYGLKGLAQSALEGLKYQIKNRYAIDKLQVKAFHLNMPPEVTEHEILIGDLSRPESVQTKELLKEFENAYAIKLFENGNIVIAATNNECLAKAINYFVSTFISSAEDKNKLVLEKGYEYICDLGDSAKGKWEINAPEYEGGTLAQSTYKTGANAGSSSSGGKMQLIHSTSFEEFNEYLDKLEKDGFEVVSRTENNKNVYIQFAKDRETLYTYYLDYSKEVRVIMDKCSIPETEFEYTYEAKEGEDTVYYQYGMMHDPLGAGEGQNCAGKWGNNGAFDIIKLADNKLILIDGGDNRQVTKETLAGLVNFLHEITGTEAGEQITVAAWFITHPHGDHSVFAEKLATQYGDEIFFERIMHNLPNGGDAGSGTVASAAIQKNPKLKFIKLHTGQNITLGNINIDVIMTHEDAVDAVTGRTIVIDDNNTSTVLKFNFNGKSIMYFGDWGGNDQGNAAKVNEYIQMEKKLLSPYRLEDGSIPTMKADMVQIAHHAINDWMGSVYAAVDADYAFFSQADIEYKYLMYPCYKNIIGQLRKSGMEDKNMYFAGRQTNWLTVSQDGTVTHGCKKIEGAPDEYWELVEQYKPFWPENNVTEVAPEPTE